jgi:predicted nucleotidyltransferase
MMNKYGLSDRVIQYLTRTAKEFQEIDKLVLFGSRAMGNFKPGSDIDLSCSGKDISRETISKLHHQLNEELPIPYFVDVLAYNTISNRALKTHIAQHGVEIYVKDRKERVSH